MTLTQTALNSTHKATSILTGLIGLYLIYKTIIAAMNGFDAYLMAEALTWLVITIIFVAATAGLEALQNRGD